MELSTQGMVTDGAGKLSSSLHSPVAPSQESLSASLSLSLRLFSPLPAASLFSGSLPHPARSCFLSPDLPPLFSVVWDE